MEVHIVAGRSVYGVSFCDYSLLLQPYQASKGCAVQVYPVCSLPYHPACVSSGSGVAVLVVDGCRVTVEACGQSRSVSVEPGFNSICLWRGVLVVAYRDKVDLHDVQFTNTKAHAASLRFPSATALKCTPNTHINRDSYLLIRCSLSIAAGVGVSMEWYAISAKQLHSALTTANATNDSAQLGSCLVPTDVLPACSVGLPSIPHCNDIHSVVYGRMAPCAVRRLRNWPPRPTRGAVTYAVALTISGQLACFAEGIPLWERSLPVAKGSHNVKGIHMQLTTSAQSPLLLVSSAPDRRLLVLDVLRSGAVLREFTHVGAYILAPLFDPLTEQLMVVPAGETALKGIQATTHGHVLQPHSGAGQSDASSSSSGTGNTGTEKNNVGGDDRSDGGEVLDNWFVYELPYPTYSTSSRTAGSDAGVRCRSVDPRGIWREDSKLVVDAEGYNRVQWQRVVHAIDHAPLGGSSGADAVSGEFVPSTQTGEGGSVGTKRPRDTDGEPGSVERGSGPALTSRQPRDRSGLIASLTALLAKAKTDYQQALSAVEQKRASVQLLRALVVAKAPPPGIKKVAVPQDLPGRTANGESYFVDVSPGAARNNPHLKALLAPDEGPPQSDGNGDDCGLGTPIEATEESGIADECALQLSSLHYRCVPLTTHVEVFAMVHNPHSQDAVFDLHLAVFGADAAVAVTCNSGRVECLSPGQMVCVTALVRIPQSAYETAGQGCLTLKVALSYRTHTGDHANRNDASELSNEDATRLLSLRLLQGLTLSRLVGRVVGIVYVDIIEAHRSWRNAPATDSDAAATMKQLLRRQLVAKYSHRGGPMGVVAQPGTPHLVDSAGRIVPVCSYAPSLCVTISSPHARITHIQRLLRDTTRVITARAAQELRNTLVEVKSSAFDMQALVDALRSTLSDGGFSTSAVAIADNSSQPSRAGTTLQWATQEDADPAQTEFSGTSISELRRSLLSAIRRVAILSSGPVSTVGDPLAALSTAVLLLRRLLPPEVTLTALVSETDRLRAIRTACLCLLNELAYTTTVYDSGSKQSEQAPRTSHSGPARSGSASAASKAKASAEEKSSVQVQPRAIEALYQQRLLTDLAVAAVFTDTP